MWLGYIVPLLLLLNHIQWIALTHFADLQILLIGKSLRLVNLRKNVPWVQCDQKKSSNVYKSCRKMISLEN